MSDFVRPISPYTGAYEERLAGPVDDGCARLLDGSCDGDAGHRELRGALRDADVHTGDQGHRDRQHHVPDGVQLTARPEEGDGSIRDEDTTG